MPSLKELRGRIAGVKNTRKITSAMKMVAASKLRRAQTHAEASRPYAEAMRRMMSELAAATKGQGDAPTLLGGTGEDRVHLLVAVTSDRGLAGGFNANVARMTRQVIARLQGEGKTVKLLTVGRKGADQLGRTYADILVDRLPGTAGRDVEFGTASGLGERLVSMFEKGEFDHCTLIYNSFVNAMTQTPVERQLIPLPAPEGANDNEDARASDAPQYDFEPDEGTLLARLLPRNLQMQIYAALLESAAGEQGARMTAMDNASRNASKAIDQLSQRYNRSRQANITNELIEIISGAEAV
ncbi:F0F1 ATP synthase subunit gamma [Tanticharoenia sakaeratensis]|jgi:F-type H+-transporting ATPase subunit gamma|uniref:ATP synthase gamma chain n=1 Tax=Tanticharoenia sakaeratensis NBRC 103193 TaxID=1231623 RepID=A0A0D6MM37_9PROT|nr:F0F1 ATP synthase subunit gamma [Tanticharoenia sakaeratensis]GAN54516.1 F0F1 ATP synthase subunit gamma [Tanticharoenia sakaeratensis NBRC 103193]GBQ23835.1 ATP synthase F0F1 subunit gamma [Tanticharoenia sakaeratensis NBRC 103193]